LNLCSSFFATLVIANVVHEDRIPGDTQFWITRPYRWKSLLGAKVLFILVFVNIPAFFAQAMIAARAGFAFQSNLGPLLWSQVLLLIVVEFPAVCVAALTSNLKQFVMSLIGAVVPVFLYRITRHPETPDQFTFAPSSVDWIGLTLAASILAVAVVVIAYLQYWRRWSAASHAMAVCAWTGAAMIALVGTSWELTAQTLLSAQPAQVADVRLDTDDVRAEVTRFPERPTIFIVRTAPIPVSGIPSGYELRGDQVFAQVEWPDGETHTSANGWLRGDSINIPIFLSEEVFNRERDQTATVRIPAYLTIFGNPRTTSVPLQETPSQITNNMSCFIGSDKAATCFTAFHSAGRVFRATMLSNSVQVWERVSYSPFPAELQLDPLLIGRWLLTRPGKETHAGTMLTINAFEPIAHFKREATLRFRLADLPVVPHTSSR
jgi:hypothetical protein